MNAQGKPNNLFLSAKSQSSANDIEGMENFDFFFLSFTYINN